MVSLKRRFVPGLVAAAAALTLAGCALPGQGSPGVAAETPEVTVTLDEVQEYCDGLLDVGISCQSDWALTLALVHDSAIEKSSELDGAWSDDEITADIDEWLETIGYTDGSATPEAIDVIRTAKAVSNLATTEEGATFLSDTAVSLEEDVVSSSRFGDFTADTFIASIAAAADTATNNASSIGDTVYVVFAAITGFADAGTDPEWLGDSEDVVASAEAEASASASPSASASATAGE
ncbi:hypothetical protein [Demequina sp. NBRC 110054]|uniref:hypothetical protein n=1 Tax=Demequina sp. NBRC 110054 TaxID=1570343 RepID=UPI000A031B32|nr:hypothetical protein [Demequina sp. NBRC 110054]